MVITCSAELKILGSNSYLGDSYEQISPACQPQKRIKAEGGLVPFTYLYGTKYEILVYEPKEMVAILVLLTFIIIV